MGSIFLSASLSKFFKVKNVVVDTAVFKLHYKLTSVVLFCASMLVTGYQFFGNPIYCIMQRAPDDAKTKQFVETFCWIESTFSLPRAYDKIVGDEVVYPGVDNYRRGDQITEHSYYQWVCLVLFLQSLLFLTPHIIWKTWEGGKIKQLLMELDKPIIEYFDRQRKFATLADYFYTKGTGHKLYFWKYVLCECLNFVNVVGQIYLIDTFLHGEFTTYGSRVLSFLNKEQELRTDPMVRVFPKITKCSFFNYGPSGDVQAVDVFCVLPLNIINEKIYVFIWFWFVILAVITALSLAYHVFLVIWPSMRYVMMKYANLILEEKTLEIVLKRCSLGDWFVLYLLAKSMDKVNFKEFIESMAIPIDNERKGSTSNS